MRNIILLLLIFMFGNITYSFDENTVLINDIKDINSIKAILYSKECQTKLNTPEFKKIINEHKKDKNYTENYYAAQGGYKYFKNNYLKAYTTKMDLMYMYSLQEHNNLRLIYYYSILGNLKYVDILYNNYPNYPYYSRKYSKSGKLISSSYYPDKNNEIVFYNDGSNYKIILHK